MSILSEENEGPRRPTAGRRAGFTDTGGAPPPTTSYGVGSAGAGMAGRVSAPAETITSPRLDTSAPPPPAAAAAAAGAPSRRQAGWGEGTTAAGQAAEAKRRAYDNADTVVSIIPDLDDAQRDDMTTQVAEAPASAFLRMPGFTELDAGMLHLPTAPDAEVDLSVLISALAPHSQLNEGRGVWTFESLFSEVSGELQTEPETAEAAPSTTTTTTT